MTNHIKNINRACKSAFYHISYPTGLELASTHTFFITLLLPFPSVVVSTIAITVNLINSMAWDGRDIMH